MLIILVSFNRQHRFNHFLNKQYISPPSFATLHNPAQATAGTHINTLTPQHTLPLHILLDLILSIPDALIRFHIREEHSRDIIYNPAAIVRIDL